MQMLQAPLTHNMLLPHGVPSRAFAPSLHARLSEPHSIRPSTQGAPGLVVHASATQVGASATPPSTMPAPTAASTMPPIWSGVRLSAQPGVRQQTPTATDASATASHV